MSLPLLRCTDVVMLDIHTLPWPGAAPCCSRSPSSKLLRTVPHGPTSPLRCTDVVMLDTYSIHESVNAERFDSERVLELVPPDGHFALMNYRSAAGLPLLWLSLLLCASLVAAAAALPGRCAPELPVAKRFCPLSLAYRLSSKDAPERNHNA